MVPGRGGLVNTLGGDECVVRSEGWLRRQRGVDRIACFCGPKGNDE